jgi:hypothetical protein
MNEEVAMGGMADNIQYRMTVDLNVPDHLGNQSLQQHSYSIDRGCGERMGS